MDTIIADRRYGWINGLVRETIRRAAVDRLTLVVKMPRTFSLPVSNDD